jgi:hypothetical protein
MFFVSTTKLKCLNIALVKTIRKGKKALCAKQAVGIDALKIELGIAPKILEGLLGVAVTCRNRESFVNAYQKNIAKVLGKNGLKTDKIVPKAFDLSRLALGQEDKVIISLFESMTEEIDRVDIYYTRYNPKKLPQISIYGEDQPTTKAPVEFLRTIANGYPHVCGFWYLSKYSGESIDRMYLDHFDTCFTPAWESLSKFPRLTVLYKGGNCNCLISSADLLLRLTTNEIKKRREDFNREGIERIYSTFTWASKKVVVHELGGSTDILRSVTPKNHRSADLDQYLARPIVFVPQEGLTGLQTKDERDVFENLPIFDDLANFLFFTNGSFKYFAPSLDVRIIKKGDYFLILGRNSLEMFRYLKGCGADLKMMTPETLKKQISKFTN